MFILLCGENEFPVTTEKGKRITDLYPHNYDHHQTTLAITNGGEEDTKHNEGLEGGRGWGVVGRNRNTLCCTNVIHFNA